MAGDKITIDVEVKGAKQSAEYISNLNKRFEEAAEGAEKLSEKLTQVSEDSQNLLAKGMSESLPEQLNDIAKGFGIASDKSLTLSTRLQAGVGAMLIAKNAISELGGRLFEYGRALDEANVRSEAQARRLRELGTATREIQQLNNGAVQSTDAYALRVSLLGDGIHATAQEQAQLIELARRHKLAGEDNAAAIQRVTAAINGDAAAQRLLGMSTEEGLTAQERFRNAIRLSANEHARLGQVQMSADEIAARNVATHQRGADALLQMVAAGTGLSTIYDGLTRSADGWTRAGQDLYRWVTESTEGHRTLGTATRNLAQETGNLGVSVETTKARMEAMNQHLIQQRDLANQAALAQKELASSLLEVNLAARSGETSGDTVNRNLRALNRQLVRGDQERRTRREVYRQAVRNGANARAVRQALGMDEPENETLIAMERSRNTESVDDLVSQLRSAGLMPNLQMARGVRGRRSTSTQLQLVMLLLQRQLQSEQRLRGIMQGGPGEMGLDGFREGGSERGTFETELGALSERGLYSGEIERQRTNMRAAAAARQYDEDKRREDEFARLSEERQNRIDLAEKSREETWRDHSRSLGGRVASGLGLKDTLEENLASPIQSAASSVNNAFSSMTQGLNGFLDTLIESPEEVGTASVAIAKNFLKGLSMMALQESLFNLAKGVAASFTPGMQASAAGYFTASAIFAGVAAATGAGAAGIAASQRGAQQVPAAANGGGGGGPARVDGGRGSDRDNRPIVINVNGAIMDREGFSNAVLDGVNDALARGGRMAA